MIVYRLQKAKHGADISGKGSTLTGGRWNLLGSNPILYTASNKSLAILEVLAHLPSPQTVAPKLILLDIFLPDKDIVQIEEKTLPVGWRLRGYQRIVQEWGTNWLRSNSSLAISVPSYISMDFNVLINPNHTRFNKVIVVHEQPNFTIDKRLL